MNILIQASGDLDPFDYLPENERKEHFPKSSNYRMKIVTGYTFIEMLAKNSDYWAGKTLMDLYLGLGTFNPHEAALKFRIYDVMQQRWPGSIGKIKSEVGLFLRRGIGPLKFWYRITCGELLRDHAWKRIPF